MSSRRVNACDRPENYEAIKEEFADRVQVPRGIVYRVAKMKKKNIHVYSNGHLVSRISDYIIYSVEAEAIEKVVAQYGLCTFFSDMIYCARHEGLTL